MVRASPATELLPMVHRYESVLPTRAQLVRLQGALSRSKVRPVTPDDGSMGEEPLLLKFSVTALVCPSQERNTGVPPVVTLLFTTRACGNGRAFVGMIQRPGRPPAPRLHGAVGGALPSPPAHWSPPRH